MSERFFTIILLTSTEKNFSHLALNRQGVTQSLEQPDFGAKLAIDSHAGEDS